MCFTLLSIAVTGLTGQGVVNPTVVRPSVAVEFENEILSLAKGYEMAFRKLPSGGKYIEVTTSTGPRFLEGSVRSVEALEGVLLIQMVDGLVHVIGARDVIQITNRKPSGQ